MVELLLEIVKPPKLWDQRARKTLEDNKILARALNVVLVEKNYKNLQKAYSDPSKILEIKWIEELKCLDYDEIRKAANSANCKDYQLIINCLVDKVYYSADPMLEKLAPGRPLDLLYVFPLYVKESWWKSLNLKLMVP